MVHGDDFVAVGPDQHLQEARNTLESKYKLKVQVLGREEGQSSELRILNKVVRVTSAGIELEADPRHAELIIWQLGLGDARIVTILGAKEEGRTQEDSEQKLKETDATRYGAIVARCNYLALDRPDIAFAVKELARQMSSPTQGGWTRLRRLGRYLVGKPRLQELYEWQMSQKTL